MVATPVLKRRQQVPKPRDRAPKFMKRCSSCRGKRGGSIDETVKEARDRRFGRGRKSGAKAQDGSSGNLGDPAHVHVEVNRQSGRRLNNDPGPEGPSDLPGAQVARHEAKRIARTRKLSK